MELCKGAKFLLTGDSITDCGRSFPVGEGEGLGSGYPRFFDGLLSVNHPEKEIRVMNTAKGGDQSRDLWARWNDDVLAVEPDYVSIMIGINDVWRHFDSAHKKELHVSLDEFEKNLSVMAESLLPKTKKVFFLTPFFMEKNKEDKMRKMTDEYGAVMKKVAKQYNCVLVDVQMAFDEYFAKINYPASLGNDRVHPNHIGHMLIAQTFYNSLLNL